MAVSFENYVERGNTTSWLVQHQDYNPTNYDVHGRLVNQTDWQKPNIQTALYLLPDRARIAVNNIRRFIHNRPRDTSSPLKNAILQLPLSQQAYIRAFSQIDLVPPEAVALHVPETPLLDLAIFPTSTRRVHHESFFTSVGKRIRHINHMILADDPLYSDTHSWRYHHGDNLLPEPKSAAKYRQQEEGYGKNIPYVTLASLSHKYMPTLPQQQPEIIFVRTPASSHPILPPAHLPPLPIALSFPRVADAPIVQAGEVPVVTTPHTSYPSSPTSLYEPVTTEPDDIPAWVRELRDRSQTINRETEENPYDNLSLECISGNPPVFNIKSPKEETYTQLQLLFDGSVLTSLMDPSGNTLSSIVWNPKTEAVKEVHGDGSITGVSQEDQDTICAGILAVRDNYIASLRKKVPPLTHGAWEAEKEKYDVLTAITQTILSMSLPASVTPVSHPLLV